MKYVKKDLKFLRMGSRKRNKNIKNYNDYTCAYVYLYINKYNLKTYIEYRYAFEGSPFYDFYNNYMTSCSNLNSEYWEAMENGELEGEILAVFTGYKAAYYAHLLEIDMIRFTYNTYGKENVYNGHIDGDEFICDWTEERREQDRQTVLAWWNDQEKGNDRKEKQRKAQAEYWTEEKRKERSIKCSGKNHPNYIKICPLILWYYKVIEKLSDLEIGKILKISGGTISKRRKEMGL